MNIETAPRKKVSMAVALLLMVMGAQESLACTAISGGEQAYLITTSDCYVVNSGVTVSNSTIYTGPNSSYNAIQVNSYPTGLTVLGTVTAYDYGVYINGTGLTGGITNGATGNIQNITIYDSHVDAITNSGTISTGTSNTASTQYNQAAIYNFGVLDSLTNNASGVITGGNSGGWGVYNRSGSIITTLTNSGSITGTGGYGGIYNAGTITTLVNNAGATLSDSGTNTFSGGNYGIQNAGTITSITNSGMVTGLSAGIYNQGSIGSITNNAGATISDSGAGTAGTGWGIQNSGGSAVIGAITNAGTISGHAGGISIDSGASVTGNITNTGSITGVGAGSVGLSIAAASTVGGVISNSGTISGVANSLNLANTSGAFTVNNTGILQGDANLGINTLNLNGTASRVIGNTTGTGQVNVNGTFTSEGTFNVGNFNVANGGVFNMNNNMVVSGSLTNSGTLNVGAASRSLTGNYVQSAGSIYQITVQDTTSNYGKLIVSGNATVANGSTLNVILNTALSAGSVIQGVIQAGGTLTVTPSSLNITTSSVLYSLSASTARNAQQLDLVTAANTTAIVNAAAANSNVAGAGIASALQGMLNNGVPSAMQPLFGVLGSMNTSQISDAVRQLTPLLTGQAAAGTNNALHSMNRIIQSRIENNRGLSAGDDFYGDQYLWAKPFGSWATQDTRNGVLGFDSRTGGIAFGYDQPVTDKVRAGGVFTYANSTVTGQSVAQSTKVDTYELAAYASYNLDPRTDINYQFDMGNNQNAGVRNLNIGSINAQAQSKYGSWAAHGSVGIGRTYSLSDATTVTPSTRLDYTKVWTDGYTETGAGALNMQVASSTYRETLVSGDVKLTHQLDDAWKLVGNVAIAYDLNAEQAQTTSIFVGGGPAAVTYGLKPSPWIERLGFGVVRAGNNGKEFTVRYDAEHRNSGFLNQTFSARVRWLF